MDRKRKHVFETATSLDSSLKKNTAFIKRLRTGLNVASQQTFISETRTLSLEKYLSEIISACAEGLSKLKTTSDIAAGTEIVSALHQRFGSSLFTKQLAWLLGKGLTAPDRAQIKSWAPEVREREEKERLSRYRVLLRIVTELWLVGILRSLDDCERPEDVSSKVKDPGATRSGEGSSRGRVQVNGVKADLGPDTEPFPLEVLKELLGHDPEHVNLPLAVLFVRNFAWDVLGVRSASEEARRDVAANGVNGVPTDDGNDETAVSVVASETMTANDKPMIEPNLRQRYLNVILRYLNDVKLHITRDQKSLNSQNRRNAEAYVKSGEIFEDRQANFEKQSKAQEKLVSNAQILCDALDEEMPDLVEDITTEGIAGGSVGIVKTGDYLRGQADGAGIWEDEDERRFYENIIDLKGRVPAILLEDGKKSSSETEDAGTQTTTSTANDAGLPDGSTSSQTKTTDDQSMVIANRTVGAQVDAILARLPELQTKDSIDQIALDFCFVNSKASRNRLVRSIQDPPKGRTDLLPLYARLAATLGQYMPDILQALVAHLDEEFRSLQRRKSKDFLGQVRMTNIRYLAELTKFGLAPEHVIFHCFKVSLDDFSRMNIEIIANLLENCGRYLLRNPETSPRMTTFLETLGRKKSAQHLGQQERMLLENAMYYVDPPQRSAIPQKERTPTELFVRQLIYVEITKRNYMKVLKTIRKLHWEEAEVVSMLEKMFSKPGKVKYSNIHLLAILVGALFRYHQDFAIGIIDNVLEQITLGLEQNDFKFNQRRIAEAKYLGELYNYKMVDSTVIFDTLYRIITFGHENGRPVAGRVNAFDPPNDFFRIRLTCTILDTCGMCFDRGSSRKKLDFFLTFFQYYLLTKDTLPMEIDFLVQDTLSLIRPQLKLATDINEASRLFSEAIAANYKQQNLEKAADVPEEADEESDSEDGLAEDDAGPEIEADQSSEEAEAPANDEDTNDESSESEEERIYVTRQEEQIDPEAEAEFDKEFDKMMAESLDSRRFERKALFDVPLPVRRTQLGHQDNREDEAVTAAAPPANTMAFSLMTKRGNRAQTKTIELPSDSNFAMSMRSKQAAEREEQQRIKNLVLNYDLRDDNDPHDGTINEPPSAASCYPLLERNPNTKGLRLGQDHFNTSLTRSEKSGRHTHRARRLNLSDVDWYDSTK